MDTKNSKGTIYLPTKAINESSDGLRPHWTPRTGLNDGTIARHSNRITLVASDTAHQEVPT